MAQRPFYASGSATQIKQFPDNEFSNMLGRIGYLYGNDPVANLSVTLSGGNAGPVLTDTRYRSGTFAQTTGDQDAFDDGLLEYDTNPGAPELLSVATYDRLNRSISPPASLVTFDAAYYATQNTKPVKWDASSNSFVEMTYLECVEAFIDQWYEGQRQPSASNPASGGGYFVSSNVSETGATLQSTTPVFVDTVADASAYQSSLIGGAGVTFTTNNFNAATGSSSTSLYSGLIGGSGIQISFSSVSPSGPANFGFGDYRLGGLGGGSARPAGELLFYLKAKVNHNGDRSWVIKKDMLDFIRPYQNASRQSLYTTGNQYKSYSNINTVTHGYPVPGDTNLLGISAGDPTRRDNNGTAYPETVNWTYSFLDNHPEWDLSEADYLYIWVQGERDQDDHNTISYEIYGGVANKFRNYSFTDGGDGSSGGASQQNAINNMVSDGIINSGIVNYFIGAYAQVRLDIRGKDVKLKINVRHGDQNASSGWAATKNVTAIANNATGFDIQTPVGTTRTAGSSWTLPFSNGNWSLAAGTWQTSTVVGASAQQSTVTFNAVSGNGTTANAALVSLGGAIDVNVTSLPGVTEDRRPPMTALSARQMVNRSTLSGSGLPKIYTGTYLFDLPLNQITQAQRAANYAAYGAHIAGSYTLQQSDVGSAIIFDTLGAAFSSEESGSVVTQVRAGPFVLGGISGSGNEGGTTLSVRSYGYSDVNSDTGRIFGHNRGTSDPFGYDADGFRFFNVRPQDVGKTIVVTAGSNLFGGSPAADTYYTGPVGGGAYTIDHPRLRLIKLTDPSASARFTATATNNTGYDIQTPVGTTRLGGSSWNLTNNAATNAWTIAAGSYLQTTGTDTYQDHFITTNYYLHQMDLQMQTQGSGYKTPLVVDYDTNGNAKGLRAMTYQEFDDFFEPLVKYVTSNLQGYRLNYNIDGNGDNIGDPILNKQMVGVTGQLATRFVNVNDYRSQMFPNGVVVAQNTHRLKLEKY